MPSIRRPQNPDDLCAIFVHAGAGYHSVANEKYHLGAVNDAAKTAMVILKNGGDATDAVEMAIRLLEDKEITNAGFGSNLTMDGLVECDATVVDYLGRSGGVGAVSQVRNPIALARLVLDESTKPLSLQRVPPNLLVGIGATEFAALHGMPILPPDYLISEGAYERWKKWKEDLNEATRTYVEQLSPQSIIHQSPQGVPDPGGYADPHSTVRRSSAQQEGPQMELTSVRKGTGLEASRPSQDCSSQSPLPRHPTHHPQYQPPNACQNHEIATDDGFKRIKMPTKRQRTDTDGSCDTIETVGEDLSRIRISQPTDCPIHLDLDRPDCIIDTVGAIAIDCFGRIAAGSSSGGIGMKHRGRCGPAALVGIGTAVIPIDPDDPERTSVATVASGTGEHMATTTAAATAAERIYHSIRRTQGKIEPCTEDEALHSVIDNDFMKHPGVMISPCTGAIGLLAVKKSSAGIYFYFGHNTDSFALASMHSAEKKPTCTMSRSKGDGAIAKGGRVCRARARNKP